MLSTAIIFFSTVSVNSAFLPLDPTVMEITEEPSFTAVMTPYSLMTATASSDDEYILSRSVASFGVTDTISEMSSVFSSVRV